ncbi:hypothetical protein [Variovorax paradoxus]|uniref:hypothetical protein n=1 Tax=Variovorax paradoxus TaxID=34073 RepID=UPI002859F02D|nr:hypothetical protein [Variovorax paradoxus]MDR6453936.1 hypothetical protein [Variovorax paradoxus]
MKEKLTTVGTLACLVLLTCLLLVHALAIFPGGAAIRWFFVAFATMIARLDAPAWVQAIGSIVAILAAIGIAMWQRQSDHRKDREREHAAATITAITLHTMLAPIVGTLEGCRKNIARTRNANALEDAKRFHGLLSSLDLPTENQLMTLHHVLPAVAGDLAVGCSRLRQAVLAVGFVVRRDDRNGDWVVDRLGSIDQFLEQALVRVKDARQALASFIRT